MEIKLRSRFQKYLIPALAILLTLGSLGFAALTQASIPKLQPVLVAGRDIAEGETLLPQDFQALNLGIGSLSRNYLGAVGKNLKALRSISRGELVAKSLVGSSTEQLIPIRLNSLAPFSKAITLGDRVDVWATEQSRNQKAAPEPVALNALVTAIETNNSMTQTSSNIELRITSEYLESLLAATDGNYKLSIILHETLADIQ
jgi:hypothetical protein